MVLRCSAGPVGMVPARSWSLIPISHARSLASLSAVVIVTRFPSSSPSRTIIGRSASNCAPTVSVIRCNLRLDRSSASRINPGPTVTAARSTSVCPPDCRATAPTLSTMACAAICTDARRLRLYSRSYVRRRSPVNGIASAPTTLAQLRTGQVTTHRHTPLTGCRNQEQHHRDHHQRTHHSPPGAHRRPLSLLLIGLVGSLPHGVSVVADGVEGPGRVPVVAGRISTPVGPCCILLGHGKQI